eukprot:CAMPEP_0171310928 /NCGR_PEP_ID=MMETSP0816-20121228/21121_1 /TAXON_ID=420281 /ORGANISM="Proboscia inermis, Strain CCAP1064/1" /LENGTH=266 /DNA_ID=CAMNT_0011795331 /DNA_START=77 /DNA_END=877 /DNA_ORIENTATION=+
MKEGKIEAIYIAHKAVASVESLKTAKLIPGVGIEGDRYALQTGTYSAKFMNEPGKDLTMVSADGVEEAIARTGMEPFSMGDLRRNIVIRGLSAKALNDMVGHEVSIGKSRLFVHRRTVPCKYREAQCKRPGLMNNLWGVCGVNCEILQGGEIRVGDAVFMMPNTYQPDRVDIGTKPPAFFIRPIDRSAEDVKEMSIPPFIGMIMCFMDPEGFQRVQEAYSSVGHNFWSPNAYRAGLIVKKVKMPFLVAASIAALSVVISIALQVRG